MFDPQLWMNSGQRRDQRLLAQAEGDRLQRLARAGREADAQGWMGDALRAFLRLWSRSAASQTKTIYTSSDQRRLSDDLDAPDGADERELVRTSARLSDDVCESCAR